LEEQIHMDMDLFLQKGMMMGLYSRNMSPWMCF